MPLIRYPGAKTKLYGRLRRLFPEQIIHELWAHSQPMEYREPFFGSGAIGFQILDSLSSKCKVWLNDKDEDLVAMWRTVLYDMHALMRAVTSYTPSVETFYEFKRLDGTGTGTEDERGFRKLVLHRTSMSGFGVMSGGPIGGRKQLHPEYNVGCRWNPESIKRQIRESHSALKRFDDIRITCQDFEQLITTAGERCFVYADPPYIEKGSQLYKHAMSEADHRRLYNALRGTKAHWVLSYDDHELVRQLYSDWTVIHELEVRYSNAVCGIDRAKPVRPKNKEVAIVPISIPTGSR